MKPNGLVTHVRDPQRLAALRAVALLDTPSDEAFERMTRLAARFLQAPVALVSLVDEDRQFFKSCIGLPEPWCTVRETSLSHSFCQHNRIEGAPLVIPDAREHPAFRNSAAIRDLGAVAYLGIPLATGDGYVLGSLCVIDSRPREWTADDVAVLTDLAAVVMTEIHLRAEMRERDRAESGRREVAEANEALRREMDERRRTEEALRGSEDLMRRILDSVPVGVVLVDAGGGIRKANDRAVDFLGLAYDRLTGMYVADFAPRTIWEDGSELPVEEYPVSRCLATGEAQPPMTVGVGRPDGTMRWGVFTAAPAGDASAGVVVTFLDVTAQKRLEDAFRQAQKMEAVGRLAGGIAHDFNNLLTVINGYTDLVLQTLPAGDAAREPLEEVRKAGDRSAELTRRLLAFSRQQVLAPRVISPNAVVADAEGMLRRVMGEDVQLETRLAPDLWAVKADPGQIQQVLVNLAVNARDAMPDGGRLTIETRNVELGEAHTQAHLDARAGAHVLLAVSDTGSGMTDAVKARIFEPFFTTKGIGKGTGLGLATVYGIVRQSGGHIVVRTEIGEGTSFEVFLPRAGESEAAGLQESTAPVRHEGTETILVVEDESQVRTLIRRSLAARGYRVIDAADGEEALRIAERRAAPIHLLVTDVVMPGLSGRDVAVRLRTPHPETRVLFLSGYTDDAVVQRGVLEEGASFLQKPFTPETLAARVRDILNRGAGGAGGGPPSG